MPRTTVLIVTVGGSPQPVIHAIEDNKPDFVYFLCSTGKSEQASDLTIENETQLIRKGKCPHCNKEYTTVLKSPPLISKTSLNTEQYQIMRVTNTDLLGEILHACALIEADIALRFGGSPRIIANYTGGTKTMTMGLGAFALQRIPEWEVQVQSAERENIIKIESGDVTQLQDISTYLLQSIQRELEQVDENFEYERAIGQIETALSRYPLAQTVKEKLNRVLHGLKMMAAWQNLDYLEAVNEAKKLDPGMRDEYAESIQRLEWIQNILKFLMQENPKATLDKKISGVEIIEDIAEKAGIRARQQRYEEAIAHLYRVTEMLAQLVLRRDYQIMTGDIRLENASIPPESKTWLSGRKTNSGKLQIGLMDAYRLLAELGHPLGAYWSEHQNPLKSYIETRNQAFSGHGFQPVDKNVWREKGERWIQWILDGCEQGKNLAHRKR